MSSGRGHSGSSGSSFGNSSDTLHYSNKTSGFQSTGFGDFSSNKVVCQICKKFGHNALDCYNQMNYSFQGHHPPPQLTAMVASSNSVWLTDSGCSTHLTPDLANLTISNDYNGGRRYHSRQWSKSHGFSLWFRHVNNSPSIFFLK